MYFLSLLTILQINLMLFFQIEIVKICEEIEI